MKPIARSNSKANRRGSGGGPRRSDAAKPRGLKPAARFTSGLPRGLKPAALFGLPIQTHSGLILYALVALGLKSLIFAPIGWWPLAFVCLVPWLIMIGGASRAPRVYFYSYMFGLTFFLLNMRWLYPATGAGYVALSAYMAVYFPPAACALRHVIRRRRWPLAIMFPVVWTGSEILRGVVMSGFPWFFLSHSLHGVLTFIQVSDLVGAYGVSFMVAAVNGAIADAIFAKVARRTEAAAEIGSRATGFSAAFTAVLVLAVVVYGQVQLHRGTVSEGPKIAVFQGDYISTAFPEVLKDHDKASPTEKMLTYLSMMDAAAEQKPDLYLLPETPWFMVLNPGVRDMYLIARESFARLQEHATRNQAYVVTGSATVMLTPYDVVDKERRYNSATVFSPDGSEPGRYDKNHLVPFGEMIPFRYGRLRFLYFWLNSLVPFSGPDGTSESWSVFPGDGFHTFSMKAASQAGREYRFGIPICYEDVMPYVSREFVSGGSKEKKVDFLLNISNDGWFGRGIQQPQHLAICVFRAVENRVGIARAVNTGVSAFIQPTGRVHDVVRGDPSTPWPGVCGYAVANVSVDSKYSFYSRYGDWFAWACALVWLIVFVDYWIVRVLEARRAEAAGAAE